MEKERTPEALAVLRSARQQVRSRSRSASYYEAADRFSELFLGQPFQLEPDYYKAVGTDYSAIDWLYEDLDQADPRALQTLGMVTERLQEMARVSSASAALGPLQRALAQPTCSVLDVCRALQGAITVLGHEALMAREGATLGRRWLPLWQLSLWRQNSQQERLNRLVWVIRAPPEDKARRLAQLGGGKNDWALEATGFTEGLHAYLERYSETGASSVAFIGALPFARSLSQPGLEELLRLLKEAPEFLGRTARLLRLAQDVRFDPTEPLNAGLMAYAAEHRLPISELDSTQLPKAELDARLRDEWERYHAESRACFDTVVASRQDETLKATLQRFVTNLHAIASRLAVSGHEVRHDPRPPG